MKSGIEAKYESNRLLSIKLLETGGKPLIEAATDPYWGANASISSKAISTNKWKGANRFGILLSEYRDQLRRELGLPEPVPDPVPPPTMVTERPKLKARHAK